MSQLSDQIDKTLHLLFKLFSFMSSKKRMHPHAYSVLHFTVLVRRHFLGTKNIFYIILLKDGSRCREIATLSFQNVILICATSGSNKCFNTWFPSWIKVVLFFVKMQTLLFRICCQCTDFMIFVFLSIHIHLMPVDALFYSSQYEIISPFSSRFWPLKKFIQLNKFRAALSSPDV